MNLRFLFTFTLIVSVGSGLKGMDADRPQLPDSSAAEPQDFSQYFSESPSIPHAPMISPLSEEMVSPLSAEHEKEPSAVSAAAEIPQVRAQGRAQACTPQAHWTEADRKNYDEIVMKHNKALQAFLREFPDTRQLLEERKQLQQKISDEFENTSVRTILVTRLAHVNKQLEPFDKKSSELLNMQYTKMPKNRYPTLNFQ